MSFTFTTTAGPEINELNLKKLFVVWSREFIDFIYKGPAVDKELIFGTDGLISPYKLFCAKR